MFTLPHPPAKLAALLPDSRHSVGPAVRAAARLLACLAGWLRNAWHMLLRMVAGIICPMLSHPWPFETLTTLVAHPDRPVRHWAMDRLLARYPAEAPGALLPLLDDADSFLVLRSAEAIADSGDAERFHAPLVERLREARGERFGRLAEALAKLDPEAARPWLLERARRGKDGLDLDEYLHVAAGLGHAGGPAERQALWEWLAAYSRDGVGARAVVDAILAAGQPADVRRVVQRLRAWPLTGRVWRTSLSVLPAAAGAGRVFEEMAYAADEGVPAMLARAATWLGRRPPLDPDRVRALTALFPSRPAAVFPELLAEAQRLTQARGDDVAGWRAAWNAGARLTGYRRLAAFTLVVLEAFHAPLVPRPERLPQEAMAGLALLCELSVGQDDEGRLAAADDRQRALIKLLAQDRENVLPGIVEQVADLGDAAVPALAILLTPGASEWGAIRAARALALIAQRQPEACTHAIPHLLDRISDDEGDFLLEACSAALAAIGPAVVDPIAAALNGDLTREIYLTGVLGEVGTDRAAEVILGLVDRRQPSSPRDIEMYSAALTDTGSAMAIPRILALWRPGDPHLAEHLLVLHAVNGLDHEELPEWRRLAAAEDERVARLTGSLQRRFHDPEAEFPGDAEGEPLLPPPGLPPPRAPAPTPVPPKRKRHRRR